MNRELEKLANIIGDVLGIDAGDITPDMEFVKDLGADSLELFQIIIGIEGQFDIALEEDVIADIVTVGDAISQIRAIAYT